jgi:hypothetical protein
VTHIDACVVRLRGLWGLKMLVFITQSRQFLSFSWKICP